MSLSLLFSNKGNPNYQNIGLLPIASAANACAHLNARLPLPVNRDQTRLYRAIFDELGANGTVALRTLTSLIDSESGHVGWFNTARQVTTVGCQNLPSIFVGSIFGILLYDS